MELIIVEFTAIVTLKGLYFKVKLSLNKCMELNKQIKHLRFILNRKDLEKMCEIIQKQKVKLMTLLTRNRGGPKVTMNYIEQS